MSLIYYFRQLAGALTPPTQGLDIHWLAITNSFVLVLLITSILLLLILRVVKTDLAKYLRIPDEELVAGGTIKFDIAIIQ